MTHLFLSPARSRTTLRRRYGIFDWIVAALRSRHSRRQLARLEAHQLEDIGLSRRTAEAESARPVWDVPAHWLK